jgi:hypothetical protein
MEKGEEKRHERGDSRNLREKKQIRANFVHPLLSSCLARSIDFDFEMIHSTHSFVLFSTNEYTVATLTSYIAREIYQSFYLSC